MDALDECGDNQARPDVLRALTNAAAQVPPVGAISNVS